jgi:hypothetical protein
MKKEMRSALDVYQDLVETLNGDQQKVNEYIDNRLNDLLRKQIVNGVSI